MLPSEAEWCETVHWVRRVIVADGKIVHNPTFPFGIVYTGSLLKTLASKVMFLQAHVCTDTGISKRLGLCPSFTFMRTFPSVLNRPSRNGTMINMSSVL